MRLVRYKGSVSTFNLSKPTWSQSQHTVMEENVASEGEVPQGEVPTPSSRPRPAELNPLGKLHGFHPLRSVTICLVHDETVVGQIRLWRTTEAKRESDKNRGKTRVNLGIHSMERAGLEKLSISTSQTFTKVFSVSELC